MLAHLKIYFEEGIIVFCSLDPLPSFLLHDPLFALHGHDYGSWIMEYGDGHGHGHSHGHGLKVSSGV